MNSNLSIVSIYAFKLVQIFFPFIFIQKLRPRSIKELYKRDRCRYVHLIQKVLILLVRW